MHIGASLGAIVVAVVVWQTHPRPTGAEFLARAVAVLPFVAIALDPRLPRLVIVAVVIRPRSTRGAGARSLSRSFPVWRWSSIVPSLRFRTGVEAAVFAAGSFVVVALGTHEFIWLAPAVGMAAAWCGRRNGLR